MSVLANQKLSERRLMSQSVLSSFGSIVALGSACACLSTALAQPIELEERCVDLGAAEFCHGLRHKKTRMTAIPTPWELNPLKWFEDKPPNATIGFEFEGYRSCSANGEAHTVLFSMSLSEPNAELSADYPDLWAAVTPGPERLAKLITSSYFVMRVDQSKKDSPSDQVLQEVFAFFGKSIVKPIYHVRDYVKVDQSLEACRNYFDVE